MDDHEARVNETTITRMSLRPGGWIGYDEESVFVQRDDEQGFKISRADIARITLNPVEWDLAVMSLLLVGIGAFVGFTRNPFVGVAFVAVGCWSLYRVYTKRNELVIYVDEQPKPVSVYPSHPTECHRTIGGLIRPGEDVDPETETSVETA